MNLSLHHIRQAVFKHTIGIAAIISVMLAVAIPASAEAKGLLALISNFFAGDTAQAVEDASKEEIAFPVAEERSARKTITVVSTAYNSLIGQTDSTPCIPASGYDLCQHYEKFGSYDTIAANFLPLGAMVRFPDIYGDKVFIVRDRMNARYGYGRVDIWLPEYAEAKAFGVKRLKMEVL